MKYVFKLSRHGVQRKSRFSHTALVVNFFLACVVTCSAAVFAGPFGEDSAHPIAKDQRERLRKSLDDQIARYSAAIKKSPADISTYTRRGDAFFFTGKFQQAIADYDKTIQLDDRLSSRHWQRGIACYYAGQFEEAAKQFEAYHSYDNVDRENGIWRYLCQAKSKGIEYARSRLLQYKQDDRPPLSSVYRLFQGTATPEQLVAAINSAELSDEERAKRLFYVHLYVGLHYELEGADELAIKHLRLATASSWGQHAGYGPNYMWHVGRIQFERLLEEQSNQ